jgi:uncharacterized membrane protein
MQRTPLLLNLRRLAWEKPIFLAVGLLLVGWLLKTPSGLLGKADAIGYAVCHRIDSRSFHLGERPISLCARCTGMYLSAVVGLVYQGAVGWKRAGMPPTRVLAALGILGVAFVVDGLNSYLHLFPAFPGLYEPNNTLRLLTGSGMGLAIAGLLFPAFNQTVWSDSDLRPALPGWRALAGALLIVLLLDLIVLTENPLVLYPLTLVSAAGVLALLTMVYAIGWLMVLRYDNRFTRIRELLLPLVGGFGVALLQVIVLDALRFLLTGTWEGFQLG